MAFKDYLKAARERLGWSRWRLYQESGVSYPYIRSLELGTYDKPSPEFLRKLSSAMHIKYEEMLDAAGYLDGLPAIEEALRLTYGDMIQDPRVFKHVQALAKLSPENRARVLDAVEMMINQRAGGSSPPRRTSNFSLEKSLIAIRRLMPKNQFGYTFGYICCIFNANPPLAAGDIR